MMVAYVHLEKGLEFQKRYSTRIIVNLKRILKLFCITDFFGALISMEQGGFTCPPPIFNLQETQGAGGLVGPLGEDSSAASS